MNEELISQIYSVKSSTVDHMKGLLEDVKNHKTQHLESKIRELEKELKNIKKSKRYGLVWEDKPEDVVERCKSELPLLKEVTSRRITKSDDDLNHLLIEGDNFHALSTLAYTHTGKVDVIYIDPPYNTGSKDFIYNDIFVDKEDTFRHSKWLSFMNRRIFLAKKLLAENGIIIFSIDENEFAQLKLLCDEVFGEKNFVGNIAVVNNLKGRSDDKHLATAHEFSFIYAKNIDYILLNGIKISEEKINEYKLSDDISKYKKILLRKTGKGWKREDRPNMFYPIFYNETTKDISLEEKNEYIKILPLTKNSEEGRWRWGKDTFLKKCNTEIIIEKNRNNNFTVYSKMRLDIEGGERTLKVKSIFLDPKYDSGKGTGEIKKILGSDIFSNPKPLQFIQEMVEISSQKDSIILDFFAGSGTTGHAVLELNKEDGGKRQCILCTNNENQIAEEVTYPRMRNVIEGYADVEGIPANLRYYKTEFIQVEKSLDDLRYQFMGLCDELLCIKENTFEEVRLKSSAASFLPLGENGMRAAGENGENSSELKLYKNNSKNMVILYDIHHFDACTKLLRTLENPTKVYIFSLAKEIYEEALSGIGKDIEIANIPDDILQTYKKIFHF